MTVADQATDPGAMIWSRGYIALLMLAAVVGIIVSIVGWLFLEVTTAMQRWVYEDLPRWLGFGEAPLWWPVPILALAGLLVGIAIDRLPGHGGHRPAGGLAGGAPTAPAELPGVVLAAVAGIGLGVVLGPEAPLLALGGGLGAMTIMRLRHGRARPGATRDGRRRQLRRNLDDLRQPGHRGRHHHRGGRTRRTDAATGVAAGPRGGRHGSLVFLGLGASRVSARRPTPWRRCTCHRRRS